MEVFYIVIGAVLALIGSVVTQQFQIYFNQIKEEDRLLFELEELLLDYHPLLKETNKNLKENTPTKKYEEISRKLERVKIEESLHKTAIRLKTKNNREISIRTTKFALDKHLRTIQNLEILTRQVQLALNKDLIEEYQNELKSNYYKF